MILSSILMLIETDIILAYIKEDVWLKRYAEDIIEKAGREC